MRCGAVVIGIDPRVPMRGVQVMVLNSALTYPFQGNRVMASRSKRLSLFLLPLAMSNTALLPP